MKKYNFEGQTEIICILDASGSMYPNTESTIDGFNKFILSQKDINPDAKITLVLFNDNLSVIKNRQKIKDSKPLTTEEYKASGTTAMNDAIGITLSKCLEAQENFTDMKNMVLIMTDGLENSSKSWTALGVKDLIAKCKSKGWEFIFMGTNIDTFSTGESLGLKESSISFSNNSNGYSDSWKLVNDCVSKYSWEGQICLNELVSKYSNLSNKENL